MSGLFETILRLSLRDQAFLIVTVLVVVLLLVSVVFALAILLRRQLRHIEERRRMSFEAWVEPLLLDVIANAAPEATLHASVSSRDRSAFVELLVRYAWQLEGEDLRTLQGLARPYLEQVARRTFVALPERRARSVRALATLGFEDHEELLVQVLDDPAPFVAMMAAQALAEKGGARHARAILERLDRFEEGSLALPEMLASMGSGAFPVIRALCLDPAAAISLRAIAIKAVEQMGLAEGADLAAEVIAGAQGNVSEQELLVGALRVLARVGRRKHLRVVRLLAGHADPVVRARALAALAEQGDERDIPALVAAIDDPSRVVALHAGQALRALGGRAQLEQLLESRRGTDRGELAGELLFG